MDRRPERQGQYGNIEVIIGPMFSGKSDVLIKTLKIAERYGKEKVQAFYPATDSRRKDGTINTADGEYFPATPVYSSREIKEKLMPGVTTVGIDEAQFMDRDLPRVCLDLAAMGKSVIVVGLPTDFKNDTFGPMGDMLAIATETTRSMAARCEVCGKKATKTQRLVEEEGGVVRPAKRSEDVIVVGGKKEEFENDEPKTKNYYEARCVEHHVVLEE